MKVKTNEMVKASLFIALGLILPFAFHRIGMGGPIFLPMHIPVLLCGFILGERYGAIVGFITPFLNSVLTGMPPIYPIAVAMALELTAYGFITGYLYKKKNVNLIISLIISMLIGRLISGIANYILLSMAGKPYALKMFITASFVKPIWGIIIQLILIPIVVKTVEKYQKESTING